MIPHVIFPAPSSGGDGSSGDPEGTGDVYLGSQEFTSSGTWTKSAALVEEFIGGLSESDIVVDIECVSGGGGGSSSAGVGSGGCGGAVRQALDVPLYALPDTVDITVGAGGPGGNSGNGYQGFDGGSTSFGELVLAPGGLGGSNQSSEDAARLSKHRAQAIGSGFGIRVDLASGAIDPLLHGVIGPGAGRPRDTTGPGGSSNTSRPEHSLVPPYPTSYATAQGMSAETVWQYGTGAGAYAGGKDGGWPGGGGGAVYSSSTGGTGGAGAIRLHYYRRPA